MIDPLCECTSEACCPFANRGRRFALCSGTAADIPADKREAYSAIVRGQKKRKRPAEVSIEDMEAMSDEEFEQRFGGCSSCGG